MDRVTIRARDRIDEVFDFIVKYKQEHDGNSPFFSEIMEGCGFVTKSHVAHYLKRLVADGKIARVHRRIHVTGGAWLPPEREGE